MSELQQLIEEQRRDQMFGDRVHSRFLSFDAPVIEDGATFGEIYGKGTEDGPVLPRDVRPKRWRTGYRERERQRKRMYGGICGRCGAVTDGSNGRKKAPTTCAKCVREIAAEKFEATPHGVIAKYRGGCRCKPCRWANARDAWDATERRKRYAA